MHFFIVESITVHRLGQCRKRSTKKLLKLNTCGTNLERSILQMTHFLLKSFALGSKFPKSWQRDEKAEPAPFPRLSRPSSLRPSNPSSLHQEPHGGSYHPFTPLAPLYNQQNVAQRQEKAQTRTRPPTTAAQTRHKGNLPPPHAPRTPSHPIIHSQKPNGLHPHHTARPQPHRYIQLRSLSSLPLPPHQGVHAPHRGLRSHLGRKANSRGRLHTHRRTHPLPRRRLHQTR